MTVSSLDAEEQFVDLVVIGAGIYGIQAARTYLEIHPTHKVVVFESSGESGGVWSKERVYDGFWTQTSLRILEFSDLPLGEVPQSENNYDFFPAKHVASYLNRYINFKKFDGQSLASRILLHSTVESITKIDEGWMVSFEGTNQTDRVPAHITTRKIIDATGLTSAPNIPTLPGTDGYKGRIIHSKDFAKYQRMHPLEEHSQRIAVIGGAKSAADIAYTCAKAGHTVSWIIRKNGAGPAAFVSAKGSGPYKNANESFYTRFTSHFLVSYFLDESRTWLGRFLYKTWLGRRVIQRAWKSINTKVANLADYDRKDGKENGFRNLKPDTEIFWQNDSTGICQHKDFFDTIAHKAKVYREDIDSIVVDGLKLADGAIVEADIIVFATGWKTSHPKLQVKSGGDTTTLSLGIPSPISKDHPSYESYWTSLEASAKSNILGRFPMLHDRPSYHQQAPEQLTPLRLYKGILPVGDNSIAFVGQMLLGNNFRVAEVQALYAVAALDGVLCLPSRQKMDKTIAETIAWDRLRYLGKGQNGSWLYWDMVPYTDDLLQDLGLTSHLHRGYWKNLFAPCYASDLHYLNKEYISKYGNS